MKTRRMTSKSSLRAGPRRFGLVHRRGQEDPAERQRGAALVEMALVLPVLFLLAFGLVETGMGWRNAITVTSAARQGARVSSHLGVNPKSDQEGLLAVQAVLGGDISQVEYVIFYEANGSGVLPPACLGSSVAGTCNRYTQAMLADAATDGNWQHGGGSWDSAWPPASREDDIQTADHLGVYISFQHEYFTGVFPGTAPLIKRETIMRIEPEVN